MRIQNVKFDRAKIKGSSCYILTFGYEERSFFLFDKIKDKLNSSNSIIFVLGEYEEHDHLVSKIKEVEGLGLRIEYVDYIDSQIFDRCVNDFLSQIMNVDESIDVHIDYSSMPKSWYCRLPVFIGHQLRTNDGLLFWYSEGEYQEEYRAYPSAGIDSFTYFSGKPSLVIDNKRTHIIALGFDIKRSTAITTIIDPEDVINCYSYNPDRLGFEESLKGINATLLARSSLVLGFDISNFSFMFSKINETVNEILPDEVIMIPDGPKPLILAMSMVANYKEKDGVTCLHVTRNPRMFRLSNVTPTGNIFGFKVHDY